MQKIKNVFLFFLLVVFALVGTAHADHILLTQFDYDGYIQMENNLESDGHTVDIVNAKTGGNIATALSTNAYDQVFFYDLTSSLYVNQDDIDALTGFFTDHNSIVVDSRSYGYNHVPEEASGKALLRNIAAEFDSRGGGLWIGTDHDPAWTQNANPLLTALGIETITGSYSQAVNNWDPSSVLLDGVNPTTLWAQGASVGSVPLGIQSNGIDMRFHFGHSSATYGAIPYISASFGEYVAPDEDPDNHFDNPVPEPTTMILFGIGLLGLAGIQRKS
ncbi:hypothetical protein DO021_15540 [Desulfobacter hydrogenophilus]|uniref:PEP-CTERM sorting domain-containing protein n=1 Tax=Desulfobacter hydrogenophilus TaxID=2291 RepID=A0A328F9Q1_9BACT|nr:PEP-CTERM sorting domain-containing protein [Desulfobacter hydrogenophilus]NDY73094.1 PEP-CTERM sorting domain-containing protein [Desulfobacter hydrogenophilus]QBH13557.1 PEP-CTERM sorting domain-containing protein [Desulfobacter hydrogenophilus]RAM01099.1 hypothetical protein DO021_15540 [Desulfobacter hydrogenophilus]